MNDKKIVGPHYYSTLKRNMVLTMILVSFAPLILIAGIILYQFHVSYHEKVTAHLEEVVQKHRQNIDGFLDEKLADIRVMTRTFTPRRILSSGQTGHPSGRTRRRLRGPGFRQ